MIFFMNMQPNQPSDSLLSKTQVIKPHNLKYYLKHILFNKITLLILIIIVIGGFILINNNLTPPTSQVKDGNLRITNVIYTPTPTEIIDIDSADDSDLGLAGYSSGTLISDNQAITLAFRKSCYDTEIYFFSFNDKTQKVIQIPFVKKDGSLSKSIFIPKGFGIPQIDSFGNTISSSYNYETGWRDKSKYKFNPEK